MSRMSSDASRALAAIVPDRWQELRERQKRLESVPRLAAALHDGTTQLEAMGSGAHGDFVSKGLVELAAPLLDAMSNMAGDGLQRSPDQIVIGSVPDDETGAAMTMYPDGSGAILLSDSLMSLLNYFAGLSISLREKPAEALPTAAVAIRYHVLHRRLFGLSALLGVITPPGQEYPRDSLSQLSLRFVLAHEAAHFCLGHDARRGDPTVEFEADRLALESVAAELRSRLPDTAHAMALVSMRLALLTTELTEKALFVRLPATHPPADLRWERATRGIDETLREGVALYTQSVTQAVEAAGDPMYRLPEAWWEQAFDSEVLAADIHDADYYAAMRHFDLLGSGDPNDPSGFLEMCEQYYGISLVGATLTAAEEGAHAGLVWLGASSDTARHLCEEEYPLTFYTLLQVISQTPALEQINDQNAASARAAQQIAPDEPLDVHTLRLTLSWCIATLVAGVMQGVYGRV
jgi:hypothetical protein